MFHKKMQSENADLPAPMPAPERERAVQARPPAPAAGPPAPARSMASGASTVLAEGSKFVGKADVHGTFRVEGDAEGEIQAADALVVGKTGNVQAKVSAGRAIVNGRLMGKVEVREGVELQAGSNVQADIKAKNMIMEDGVQFRGKCEIGS